MSATLLLAIITFCNVQRDRQCYVRVSTCVGNIDTTNTSKVQECLIKETN